MFSSENYYEKLPAEIEGSSRGEYTPEIDDNTPDYAPVSLERINDFKDFKELNRGNFEANSSLGYNVINLGEQRFIITEIFVFDT